MLLLLISKKAFDSIDRTKLWKCLFNCGLHGKMLTSIMSIYCKVKTCVKSNNGLTECFDCPVGLKQGCVLSPVLFSLFISQLSDELAKYGKHGVQLFPDLLEIILLMFADNVVLVSDTIPGLQNQLNILYNFSEDSGLQVNLDKTNIVVFRRGVAWREMRNGF